MHGYSYCAAFINFAGYIYVPRARSVPALDGVEGRLSTAVNVGALSNALAVAIRQATANASISASAGAAAGPVAPSSTGVGPLGSSEAGSSQNTTSDGYS